MQVYIKNRKRRKDEFQFFMHDFVDTCKRNGIRSIPDYIPTYRFHIRSFLRRLMLLIYSFKQKICPRFYKKNKAVIITANGISISDNFFPYYFEYELIPFLWDVWPSTWLQMQRDFQRFGVKIVFVTARSVANMINEEMPWIKAIWIPEGIEMSHYSNGLPLKDRPYNVLELGRQMKAYHSVLEKMYTDNVLNGWTTSIVNPDGTLDSRKLTFPNDESLYDELPKYKIMVCFPQCDTNQFRGGNVETLTQRYWEAMLSGCLIIGRAPQELIDLIGYNPVIDVDWNAPEVQLQNILGSIDDYQSLVDKNVLSACKNASWHNRIDSIKVILKENGYTI